MLTVLLLAALAFSDSGKITGTIVEARTGAPLPAVLVKVQSTGQQAFSDGDGKFEIADVPVGSQTLLVSVVGYGLVRRDVTVSVTDVVDVTIPVNEGASTYVEEVSVGGSRFRETEPGVGSQQVLGSREILALRGLVADDPFRAVQVLPGVTTGDDFRAEFAVRGLGPSNIGISIDGVDSPLLFHTVRGVQDTGSLALINSDILESASLLAGPHPQRLNSHLGSRLDFTTRDGSRDRLTVRGMVSASAASTVVEGPLGSNKNASWLVSLRKSYIDWLLRKIDSTTDASFGFTDGQAKLTIDLTPRQTLRATVIAGQSVLRENDSPPDVNTLDPATNTSVIGNLQWRFTPSAAFTTSQQLYYIDSNYRNQVYDGRTREEGYDHDLTWRGSAGWNPAGGHMIEFGAQAQSLNAKRIDRRFQSSGNNREQTLLDTTVDTWSAGGWAHYRWTPNTRLSITPGVRVDHWQLYDQTDASPWLLTEYEVRPGTRLRASAGIQHQSATIDQSIYALPTVPLVPERAATIEAGIDQRFGAAWRLTLSGHHRRDDDRLRFINSDIRIVGNRVVGATNPYWENALTGNTNGAEVVIERRAASGLNGWFSYSWSDSTVTDAARRETFPADFDQRHTVNTYVAYRWGGKTSLSARMRYGSNFPIVGYVGKDADGYVVTTERNGLRLPEYARLDLRADRAFTYRKSRLTLFIEVVNATNRDNYRPNTFFANTVTRRVFEPVESLFPLLPVAGVLIEFYDLAITSSSGILEDEDTLLMHSSLRSALACCLLGATLVAQGSNSAVAQTPYTPSLDPAAMDRAADPCVDFYQFACGGWMKNNPIPPDQSSWTTYGKMQDENRALLRALLEQFASGTPRRTSTQQKIGDYYAACMAEPAIERRGAQALAPQMAAIEKIASIADLAAVVAASHRTMVVLGPVLFSLRAEQDAKDSTETIAGIDQSGLGLPDRDYYLKDDAQSVALRTKYVEHVARVFQLMGDAPAVASANAQIVLRIETGLAGGQMSRVERRNPDSTYHRMPRATLKEMTPSWPWDAYFTQMGIPQIVDLNVAAPGYFTALERQLTSVPLNDWKAYLRWHTARLASPYLSAAFVDADFAFFSQTLAGAQQLQPRWKRCVGRVDRHLGEALGQVYVEKYFTADTRARTLRMVRQIEQAMDDDIKALGWMSAETKTQALDKLHGVTNKIGHPERWRDYSSVAITADDFYGDAMNAMAFEVNRQLVKIGKPLVRGEWYLSPPTVNANYDPQMNEINFPAGQLQPPAFDPRMDDAPNYGNTGGTIGHELTHGFDDEGRLFDAKGNRRDWWTPADGAEFERRTSCLVDQYSSYAVAGDVKVNGKLTLGENVADLGGLILAYRAWVTETSGKNPPSKDGLSPIQRFFVGYAQSWCANTRPEAERMRAITNSHSPEKYRANGVVSNMPEFAAAFACKAGQPMVRQPACTVW